jgi:alpha-beta hydrolase superfamily lysophospholipase
MAAGSPTSASADLGAWAYWPDNPFWSFQFIRLVEQANTGGSDFSEAEAVARNLPVGDAEAWYAGFTALAERLESEAERAHADGHVVSARETWLRASNYHRAAGFFLSPADERHAGRVIARRRCFGAAAEHSEGAIEPVEVPYEDTTLPGYMFAPPAGTPRPAPAAIIFGGADAVAEEMYFFLGRALAERGFAVLAFDGPGQGEALRRGIVARPDFEVAVRAVVDHLLERNDVDGDQIVLVGQSLGGYYASRAAAFEPRLKACVIWGALYDLHRIFEGHLARADATAAHFVEQFKLILGVADVEAIMSTLEAFTLDGIAERIRTPTLIVHGEADMLCPIEDAHRTFGEIPTDEKDLIVYPRGEPGCTHCQVDALPLVTFDICNWLERRIRS